MQSLLCQGFFINFCCSSQGLGDLTMFNVVGVDCHTPGILTNGAIIGLAELYYFVGRWVDCF
jgi:hypothetical protein